MLTGPTCLHRAGRARRAFPCRPDPSCLHRADRARRAKRAYRASTVPNGPIVPAGPIVPTVPWAGPARHGDSWAVPWADGSARGLARHGP